MSHAIKVLSLLFDRLFDLLHKLASKTFFIDSLHKTAETKRERESSPIKSTVRDKVDGPINLKTFQH